MESKNKALVSFILGIISMIAWVLPIAGLPIQIVGLVFGIKGKDASNKWMAITGIVLCIIGLVFTIVNASLGGYNAYLEAIGQASLLGGIIK